MLNPKAFGSASAIFIAIFFIPCFWLWNQAIDPSLQQLHLDILRLSYPGLTDWSLQSFFIGLAESVVYGFVGGWLLAWLYNSFASTTCCKK